LLNNAPQRERVYDTFSTSPHQFLWSGEQLQRAQSR